MLMLSACIQAVAPHNIPMGENAPYRYHAFISHSYSEEATRYAKKLARFLRKFKTPKELLKERPELPRKPGTVYYPKIFFQGGDLYRVMPGVLADSDFLIVICTKDYAMAGTSPEKPLCYADIATASFLGRAVIPGEPHGIPLSQINDVLTAADEKRLEHLVPIICRPYGDKDDPRNYFPPILRILNYAAPDTGTTPREKEEFVAVAAQLLGVTKAELLDPWKIEEKRRKAFCAFWIIGFILALLIGIAKAWSYYFPHYSYYADYVERDNIPQGIHPLNKEERRLRSEHYRITEQFHNITRIERLNPEGNPSQTPAGHGREDRPASYELIYDTTAKKETVLKHLCYDSHGKLIQERAFSGHSVLFFFPKQTHDGTSSIINGCAAFAMGPEDEFEHYRSKFRNINHMEREVKNGLVTHVYFKDIHDNDAPDTHGVWGLQYERDDKGRICSVTYLNKDKQPCRDIHGATGCRYEYSPDDELLSVTYVNKTDGREIPAIGEWGWAKVRYTYAVADGNATTTELLSSVNPDNIISKVETEYKNGHATKTVIKSASDSDTICVSYNRDGYAQDVRHGDINGTPRPIHENVSRITYDYDDKANITSMHFYGPDFNTRCTPSLGFSAVWLKYKNNRPVRIYLFDEKGHLHMKGSRMTHIVLGYDNKDNNDLEEYYDAEQRLCRGPENYAIAKRKYDTLHNLCSESYFDTHHTPCLNDKGYAKVEFTRDEDRIIERYFDTENKPCNSVEGYAVCRRKTGSEPLPEWEDYYDTEGKRCCDRRGYAKVSRTYQNGNIVAESYEELDDNGELRPVQHGCAKVTFSRNEENGSMIESYFDSENRLCNNAAGYAILHRKTGSGELPEWEAYYEAPGKRCCDIQGHAQVRRTYKNGALMEESYDELDGNGELRPVQHGWAQTRWTYDNDGNMLSMGFYDAVGNLYNHPDGYALDTWAYDSQGRLISEEFFDENQHPCISSEGYSRAVYRYDTAGNPLPPEYYAHDMKCRD